MVWNKPAPAYLLRAENNIMTMHENVSPDQPMPSAIADGKRPYCKPAFAMESVFETMALSCGKISGTQAACNSRRKVS